MSRQRVPLAESGTADRASPFAEPVDRPGAGKTSPTRAGNLNTDRHIYPSPSLRASRRNTETSPRRSFSCQISFSGSSPAKRTPPGRPFRVTHTSGGGCAIARKSHSTPQPPPAYHRRIVRGPASPLLFLFHSQGTSPWRKRQPIPGRNPNRRKNSAHRTKRSSRSCAPPTPPCAPNSGSSSWGRRK